MTILLVVHIEGIAGRNTLPEREQSSDKAVWLRLRLRFSEPMGRACFRRLALPKSRSCESFRRLLACLALPLRRVLSAPGWQATTLELTTVGR